MTHPPESWQWFGQPGHFICGEWCRFHMLTLVGDTVISTVGKLVHPSSSHSEATDREYLLKHPHGDTIGCDRTYETMAFRLDKICDSRDCGCGAPLIDVSEERGFSPANDPITARRNHMDMCYEFANHQPPQQQVENKP